MTRVRSVVSYVLGFLVFAAGAAHPQVVDNQLEHLQERYGDDGFRRAQGDLKGSLDDDERESVSLSLEGGFEYVMHGVCDGDCDDIDLRLRDSNGNEVDVDVLVDDQPIVRTTPTSATPHK